MQIYVSALLMAAQVLLPLATSLTVTHSVTAWLLGNTVKIIHLQPPATRYNNAKNMIFNFSNDAVAQEKGIPAHTIPTVALPGHLKICIGAVSSCCAGGNDTRTRPRVLESTERSGKLFSLPVSEVFSSSFSCWQRD